MGVFFLCEQSFLSTCRPYAIFSVWGGGLIVCMGGGALLGLPPITIFAGASCHKYI